MSSSQATSQGRGQLLTTDSEEHGVAPGRAPSSLEDVTRPHQTKAERTTSDGDPAAVDVLHKAGLFLFSGLLITGNFIYLYFVTPRLRMQAAGCPTEGAGACGSAERLSRVVLWISAGVYLTGFFASYLLGSILMRLES